MNVKLAIETINKVYMNEDNKKKLIDVINALATPTDEQSSKTEELPETYAKCLEHNLLECPHCETMELVPKFKSLSEERRYKMQKEMSKPKQDDQSEVDDCKHSKEDIEELARIICGKDWYDNINVKEYIRVSFRRTAVNILDKGYSLHKPQSQLVPLDRYNLREIMQTWLKSTNYSLYSLEDMIVEKFCQPKSVSLEEILDILIKTNSTEECRKYIREGKAVYIALGDLKDMAQNVLDLVEGKK